ncbi:MAG TPA: phospholipase D-like domain-containing protein [Steroidobacteraceae bacterium]|nr:phospholipase D-like domain-containing protein [Steroidobacteraceae bacterium]
MSGPAAETPVFPERVLGEHRARWLATVDEAYGQMQRLIEGARLQIRCETYLMREEGPAQWLRAALLAARARKVDVWLLIDAFGSEQVGEDFLQPLRDAGVHVGIFNPKRLLRLSFRNHRKLLAVDGASAVVGGFNIAPEYAGDGVNQGWCDTGVLVSGPVVGDLEHSFDRLWHLAPFTPAAIRAWREVAVRPPAARHPASPVTLLLSGPALHRSAMGRSVRYDLHRARDVAIASAYFLPSSRTRRMMYHAVERGGRVRVLLAGRSDVPLAQRAAEHLYARLMRRRVDLFEYQPQILHVKLLVMDDTVYVGSSNLDRRSLQINFELLLRLQWPELAADARRWYETALSHSTALQPAQWNTGRSIGRRLWSWVAYLLLSRVDPLIARRRFRAIS